MTRRLAHLERLFPNLQSVGYVPKSRAAARYNCVAWAAEDATRIWQGSNIDGYWPPGAVEGYDFDAIVSAFEQLGFAPCGGGAHEAGYVKAALYGDERGKWTHAARQLPDGRWTSKIGAYEDVIHKTPHALVGSDYGDVLRTMRRSLSGPSPPPPPPLLKKPTPKGRQRKRRSDAAS
jgi:hypothetical protein